MRSYIGNKVLVVFFVTCATSAFAQEKSCIDSLVEKAKDNGLVRIVDALPCVQEVLSQHEQKVLEVARSESQKTLDNYKAGFDQVSRMNVVYLGRLNSCRNMTIHVPKIDSTTTDDWRILTSTENYTAHFGTGEMRNNAIYSVSYSFTPSADKKSWVGYLSMQVNPATEQKKAGTDACKGGSNKNGSSAELYAIRK